MSFSTAILVHGLLAATAPGQELLELLPLDGAVQDYFGETVALEGVLALVSATGYDGPHSGVGAVYVFDAYSGQQRHLLTAPDAGAGHYFGSGLALEDGVALIGASNDGEVAVSAGAVYAYDALGGVLIRKLLASDGQYNDGFGGSVSVDGGIALIGASGDDDLGDGAGSAYLFDVAGGQQLHKLVAADGSSLDTFGGDVCISGALALVGAHGQESNGSLSGAAYVFDVASGNQLHKLTPSDPAPNDWFGWNVSLDGNLALLGSHRNDDHGNESGSAYLFDAQSGQQLMKLTASDAAAFDNFGTGVELSEGLALVGAVYSGAGGVESGAVYVFDAASGVELKKLTPADGADDDFFAYREGLAFDGGRALIGSFWHGDNGWRAGAAYIYTVVPPGSAYCLGEPGSGTRCPCNNDNDGSVPGSGCANGATPAGARLIGNGNASLSAADDLVLTTTGLPPGSLCVYFQAEEALNGGQGQPFGDGLRCAAGEVIRLEFQLATAAGISRTTRSLVSTGGVSAGDVKRYQTWYEDTTGNQPCGAGVHDFNLSNGYEISWLP